MNKLAAVRPARVLTAALVAAAAALGAACSNPVGPRAAVAAPRASVQPVAEQGTNNAGVKSDSAAATPVPQERAYSGGGTIPWY